MKKITPITLSYESPRKKRGKMIKVKVIVFKGRNKNEELGEFIFSGEQRGRLLYFDEKSKALDPLNRTRLLLTEGVKIIKE